LLRNVFAGGFAFGLVQPTVAILVEFLHQLHFLAHHAAGAAGRTSKKRGRAVKSRIETRWRKVKLIRRPPLAQGGIIGGLSHPQGRPTQGQEQRQRTKKEVVERGHSCPPVHASEVRGGQECPRSNTPVQESNIVFRSFHKFALFHGATLAQGQLSWH
jgi:hypothetical protein